MDIQKEREAFEAWFESRYDAHFMQFALDLDLYVDKHTQTCWEAWQAARVESHKQAALYQFEINHLAQANQQWREKAAKAQAVLKSPVMAFDEWFKKRHEKTGLYEEALCGKDDATYIKHEMNKAFQAGRKEKQAVPEGFVEKTESNTHHYFKLKDWDEWTCIDGIKDAITSDHDINAIVEVECLEVIEINNKPCFALLAFGKRHGTEVKFFDTEEEAIEAQEPAND